MDSKVHGHNKGRDSVEYKSRNHQHHYRYDDEEIGVTYWRSKNPKITKAKIKDLRLKNRFEFGNDAPIRYQNFAWLKKNHRKDYFGVMGKDYKK